MANNDQDTFNQAVANAQWEAYGKALAEGKSAEEAIRIGRAAAQDMRNERSLQNSAERSDFLRPHKTTIAQSIMRVIRRGGR